MFRTQVRLVVGGLVLCAAVVSAGPAQDPTYVLSDVPPSLRPAVTQADEVIASLQKALQTELTRELTRGGPERALKSCHLEAIEVAQQVGRERGFAAGRTSHRLRNPLNAPRPWAAPTVARFAGRLARDVEGFAVDLGDRVGVMRPIAHRAMCSTCHGSDAQIHPGVRKELEALYPADAATGFKDGEIRGWFWVEVPHARDPLVPAAASPRLDEEDAAALADFAARVLDYVELHRRLEEPLPKLVVTRDPAETQRAREALGAAVRSARSRASQGEIFRPASVRAFRRLIEQGCDGRLDELLEIVSEEVEGPVNPPRVNARWDSRMPFTMVPPRILCAMPSLPHELEYRFIGRALVLYDAHADLIVDFIPFAIRERT